MNKFPLVLLLLCLLIHSICHGQSIKHAIIKNDSLKLSKAIQKNSDVLEKTIRMKHPFYRMRKTETGSYRFPFYGITIIKDGIDFYYDTIYAYAIRQTKYTDVTEGYAPKQYRTIAGWVKHMPQRIDTSPLNLAILLGRTERVAQLIAAGANINDETHIPPLLLALRMPNLFSCSKKQLNKQIEQNINIAKLLLESGANPNVTGKHQDNTPLHHALKFGDSTLIQTLFNKTATVSFAEKAHSQNTPLIRHVFNQKERCKASIVKLLLENGADPNVGDALIKAIFLLQENTLNTKLLLDFGADPFKLSTKLGIPTSPFTVAKRLDRPALWTLYKKVPEIKDSLNFTNYLQHHRKPKLYTHLIRNNYQPANKDSFILHAIKSDVTEIIPFALKKGYALTSITEKAIYHKADDIFEHCFLNYNVKKIYGDSLGSQWFAIAENRNNYYAKSKLDEYKPKKTEPIRPLPDPSQKSAAKGKTASHHRKVDNQWYHDANFALTGLNFYHDKAFSAELSIGFLEDKGSGPQTPFNIPTISGLSLGTELGRSNYDTFIIAPKAAVCYYTALIGMRLNAAYYTDFCAGVGTLKPEAHLSFVIFTVGFGYQIVLGNSDLITSGFSLSFNLNIPTN